FHLQDSDGDSGIVAVGRKEGRIGSTCSTETDYSQDYCQKKPRFNAGSNSQEFLNKCILKSSLKASSASNIHITSGPIKGDHSIFPGSSTSPSRAPALSVHSTSLKDLSGGRVRFDEELQLTEHNLRRSCRKLFATLYAQKAAATRLRSNDSDATSAGLNRPCCPDEAPSHSKMDRSYPIHSDPRLCVLKSASPSNTALRRQNVQKQCRYFHGHSLSVSPNITLVPCLHDRNLTKDRLASGKENAEAKNNICQSDDDISTKTVHKALQNNGSSLTTVHKVPQNNGSGLTTVHKVPQNNGSSLTTVHKVPQNNGSSLTTVHKALQNNGSSLTTVHKVPQNNGSSSSHISSSEARTNLQLFKSRSCTTLPSETTLSSVNLPPLGSTLHPREDQLQSLDPSLLDNGELVSKEKRPSCSSSGIKKVHLDKASDCVLYSDDMIRVYARLASVVPEGIKVYQESIASVADINASISERNAGYPFNIKPCYSQMSECVESDNSQLFSDCEPVNSDTPTSSVCRTIQETTTNAKRSSTAQSVSRDCTSPKKEEIPDGELNNPIRNVRLSRPVTDQGTCVAGVVISVTDQGTCVAGVVISVTDQGTCVAGVVISVTDQGTCVAGVVISVTDQGTCVAGVVVSVTDQGTCVAGVVISVTYQGSRVSKQGQAETPEYAVIDKSKKSQRPEKSASLPRVVSNPCIVNDTDGPFCEEQKPPIPPKKFMYRSDFALYRGPSSSKKSLFERVQGFTRSAKSVLQKAFSSDRIYKPEKEEPVHRSRRSPSFIKGLKKLCCCPGHLLESSLLSTLRWCGFWSLLLSWTVLGEFSALYVTLVWVLEPVAVLDSCWRVTLQQIRSVGWFWSLLLSWIVVGDFSALYVDVGLRSLLLSWTVVGEFSALYVTLVWVLEPVAVLDSCWRVLCSLRYVGVGFGACCCPGQLLERVFVSRMKDHETQKLLSGLTDIGDEILEIDGVCVKEKDIMEVNSLMAKKSTILLTIMPYSSRQDIQ
ncbi:uncharacterized protein LOC106475471, partial [Limulus polyphemus]|uniref:Uncharacterized protein LOC106475471 n=1 Tax=Limulus polyphemus TaxID=6850 RepID=A0ABM1RV70_LIMPO